ncbi:MAG: phosphotransferase [Candidatus Acidiferrales bacterium]
MNADLQTNKETYRLIVTRRNASEILLRPHGSAWRLPSVEIPQSRRVAEELTAELYAQWACRAYCLLVPALASALPHCGVMEVTDLEQISPAGTCWKPLDVATCAAVDPAEDRTVLEKAIKEWAEYRREPSEAPFTKPGWLSELLTWAQEQLAPLGVRLTGSFAQLNASPHFSLIRLETNDASAVWFKATGESNRHELRVASCVARLFPGYVPEVLGIHSSWNAWLMREVSGRALDDVRELSTWRKPAEDLARLQILSVGKEDELLDGQCKDLRLPRLFVQIDPFIDRMRGLMAAQEKRMPAPLTDPELTRLGNQLKQACSSLCEVGLPDTLGHLDFNPGNIFILPGRTVFLDWAEGCVTNPVITFEYLREHLRRNRMNDMRANEGMVVAYVRPWESFLSPDTFRQAMVMSPLVAVFVYAVAGNTWRSSEAPLLPSVAAYLRSLARRMYRETSQRIERREQCPA